jgi:hypothetical protein
MEFDAYVTEQFDADDADDAGGAVLVRHGESVPLDRGYGQADHARQRTNAPRRPFKSSRSASSSPQLCSCSTNAVGSLCMTASAPW